MKQHIETFTLYEIPLRDLLEGEALELYDKYFDNSQVREVNANELANDLGRMLRTTFVYNFDELTRFQNVYPLIPGMKEAWSKTVNDNNLTLYGVCRHGRDLFTRIADGLRVTNAEVDTKTSKDLPHNLNAIITDQGIRIVNSVSGSTTCYMLETPKDLYELGKIYSVEISPESPLLMLELPVSEQAAHALASYDLEVHRSAIGLADSDETIKIQPTNVMLSVYEKSGHKRIVRGLKGGEEFIPAMQEDTLILKNIDLSEYNQSVQNVNMHADFDLIE